MSAKCCSERVQRRVSDPLSDFCQGTFLSSQEIARNRHSPVREVPHRRLAKSVLEYTREIRAGHVAEPCQFVNSPRLGCVPVYSLQGTRQP